jgi:hypothetical protein
MDTIRRKSGKSAIQLGSLSAADLTGEKKPEHDQP